MAEFWKDCISHTINWYLSSPCEQRNTIVKCTVGVLLTLSPGIWSLDVQGWQEELYSTISISNHICLEHYGKYKFLPEHFLDLKAYPLLHILFKTSKIIRRHDLHPCKVLLESLILKMYAWGICLCFSIGFLNSSLHSFQ